MIPWVQVYSNLPSHDKTISLAEALGLKCPGVSPETVATGMLVSLWSWAVQNRTDGDLRGVSARTIAKACQWGKAPDKLVQALKDCGWLDADMHIHDWEEYSVRLMENEERQKERTRIRVSEYRERRKQELGNGNNSVHASNNSDNSNNNVTVTKSNAEEPCNAPVTQCNAPTVPNLTVPNLTVTVGVDDNSVTGKPVTHYAADKTEISTDLDAIREAWNSLGLGMITPIDPMSARGAAVQLRVERYGIDGVLAAIEHCRESAFLRGENERGWRASFDWLMEETHCQRAIEGGYADFGAGKKTEKTEQERRDEKYGNPRTEDMAKMQEMLRKMEGNQC